MEDKKPLRELKSRHRAETQKHETGKACRAAEDRTAKKQFRKKEVGL